MSAQGPQTNRSADRVPGKTRKCRHCYRCKGSGKIAWALCQSVEASAKADQHHSSARSSRAWRCRVHRIPLPASVTTAKRPS